MTEENSKPFNAHQRWELNQIERGRKELLKWQEETGITLVQIRDPDGMETFDEDGNRVRQYNLSRLFKIINDIEEKAKNDPIYGISPQKALDRAAEVVVDELIREGKSVVLTSQQISEMKDFVENLAKELALDPTVATSIRKKLVRMREASDILPDADRVRNFLSTGESKTIEFKESFSLDVKKQTQKKESCIEESSLKTLVAFLNTEGGVLLVGVSDDRQIRGVDVEIEKFHEKSIDNFLLYFKNRLRDRIGAKFYPFITDYRMVKLEDEHILLVECKASQTPCFLIGEIGEKGKDSYFYVRTGPATEKLEGPKLIDYVKHHFR